MNIEQEKNTTENSITGYAPGKIKINKMLYKQSLIITPDAIVEWEPRELDELTTDHLNNIIDLKPEIVLIGTGETQNFPKPLLYAPFYQKKIGIEFMNNAAACRTYNVLLAEGRRVAMGLLLSKPYSP